MNATDATKELPGDLITTTEAAAILRMNVASVSRMAQAGRIPSWRRSNRIFVRRADVLAMFIPTPTSSDLGTDALPVGKSG